MLSQQTLHNILVLDSRIRNSIRYQGHDTLCRECWVLNRYRMEYDRNKKIYFGVFKILKIFLCNKWQKVPQVYQWIGRRL